MSACVRCNNVYVVGSMHRYSKVKFKMRATMSMLCVRFEKFKSQSIGRLAWLLGLLRLVENVLISLPATGKILHEHEVCARKNAPEP